MARAVAEDPFSRDGRGRDTVPAISASENGVGVAVVWVRVGIWMRVGREEEEEEEGGGGRRPEVGTSWREGAVWVENSCHVGVEVEVEVEVEWWWRRAVV